MGVDQGREGSVTVREKAKEETSVVACAFTGDPSSNRCILRTVARVQSQVEHAAGTLVRRHPETSPTGYISLCSPYTPDAEGSR